MQEAQTYFGSEPRFTPCNVHNVKEEMNETLSRYRAAFFRRAYLVLENAADAEDAVQDALLSAYKHIDQFRGEAQLSTWLTAIVSNSARMQLRRRPRHIHVSLDEPVGEEQEHSAAAQLADGRQNPEDECRSTELHARLKNLLTQLPPSLRRVFQLRDLDGLTTREAAELLGVADGTVKGQLAKARTRLRKLMAPACDSQHRARRTHTTTPSMSER